MQLMPATAARFGVKNIFDPEQNIHGAAQYLRFLLDLFDGNVSLALAGYNAGEGAVKKYGYAVPPTPRRSITCERSNGGTQTCPLCPSKWARLAA